VGGRKRGVRPHLVDEDQPLRLDLLGYHNLPGRSQELISFQRPHCPFFERSQAASSAALR
jgi:hypothetical protein